ncbi:hypothetical protein J2Z28_005748, partial [Paenibacillus xylanexedens]|nr:hypothetical protein [Paenibacillus xylanexedens]
RRKKNIGKPYEGKPHVRFDEEGLGLPSLLLYLRGEIVLFAILGRGMLI